MCSSDLIPMAFSSSEDVLGACCGLYPPAKSNENKQFDNATSREMCKATGSRPFWNWIDIFTFMPAGLCKYMDLYKLGQHIEKHDTYRGDWLRRVTEHVKRNAQLGMPILYVAGEICNKQFNALQLNLKTIEGSDECVSFSTCQLGGITCMVMTDQPHPSAHLMAHGERGSRHRFASAMHWFNALCTASLEPNQEATAQEIVTNATTKIDEIDRLHLQGLKNIAPLFKSVMDSTRSNWFSPAYKHIRLFAFHDKVKQKGKTHTKHKKCICHPSPIEWACPIPTNTAQLYTEHCGKDSASF